VYLRALAPQPPAVAAVQLAPVFLALLLRTEIVREACTIALLASAAWMAARRTRDVAGAFLLTFGLWDLVYYVALRLIVGWPETLSSWDILFLIPVPWMAPVWAPMIVAAVFVSVGTFLFHTPSRASRYTTPDVAVLLLAAAAIVVSFLAEWRSVTPPSPAPQFRQWLYWTGLVAGVGWFIRVESRPSDAVRGALTS
jgi:hypothetical protein